MIGLGRWDLQEETRQQRKQAQAQIGSGTKRSEGQKVGGTTAVRTKAGGTGRFPRKNIGRRPGGDQAGDDPRTRGRF